MVIRLTVNCSLGVAGRLVNVPMGQGAEIIKRGLGYEYICDLDRDKKVLDFENKDEPKRKRGRPKKCTTD